MIGHLFNFEITKIFARYLSYRGFLKTSFSRACVYLCVCTHVRVGM